jgi:uncharacterized coiled-coil DUF342 family protein
MSKTIDLQIEKSRVLIEGIRKNIEGLRDKGFNEEELNQMEAELSELKKANDECDVTRAELSEKVKRCNEIMTSVKEKFSDKKKAIKGYYPQEEWIRYGVQDKR